MLEKLKPKFCKKKFIMPDVDPKYPVRNVYIGRYRASFTIPNEGTYYYEREEFFILPDDEFRFNSRAVAVTGEYSGKVFSAFITNSGSSISLLDLGKRRRIKINNDDNICYYGYGFSSKVSRQKLKQIIRERNLLYKKKARIKAFEEKNKLNQMKNIEFGEEE